MAVFDDTVHKIMKKDFHRCAKDPKICNACDFRFTAEINEEGSDDMAEHRVRKNNIIYIIPDDGLFRKWKNNEAFIDEYGRLMNRKPHRVLKELKHYVEDAPMVQQRTSVPSAARPRKGSPVMDYLKDTARDKVVEVSDEFIDRAVDKFF